MILKKQNIMEKVKNSIEKLILTSTGTYNRINKEYAEDYFNEVLWDWKILGDGLKECKFERDRNELFQSCVKKYSEEYCPSTYYKYFSNKNKLKYLGLRMEIDKILSRKDQFLPDLSNINTEIIYN